MAVVAIVGRPNVGKSTLFNTLTGQDRAIVGPERGITRDRIYGRWIIDDVLEADLIDTGGFDTIDDNPFARSMRDQTLTAIEGADIILCVFDSRTGINRDDEELVGLLRPSKTPVVYVANKVDDPNNVNSLSLLYETGLDDFVKISAKRRSGVKELASRVKGFIGGFADRTVGDESDAVCVSILGRPNVGKSLLLNRIIGQDRAIVSPEAGTTRDYVDIRVRRSDREYMFVDTAGIRRKSRIDDNIERLSVMRSIKTVTRSHVSLMLIDPREGLTEQDKRLCSIIMDHGRPFVLVVNKSDLLTPQEKDTIREDVVYALKYIPDVNVLFTSALSGKNVHKLYSYIDNLFLRTTTKITTPKINKILHGIIDKHPPPLCRGKTLKFFYVTQVSTLPPTFRIVTNQPKAVPVAYSRYLTKSLKKACGMEGIAVRLHFVGKRS